MDAIKKKMQAMKLEKDNAMDRALLCEQQARDANLRAEKVKHTDHLVKLPLHLFDM
jgi:tropomyosin-1